MKGRIAAFIFDLDGVLTDTAEFHYQAWKRLAEEEGVPFDRRDNERLRGVSRRDSLLILLRGRAVTEEGIAAMMERKNRYYVALLQRMGKEALLPGATEILTALRRMGYKTAVGSVSKNTRTVIGRLGLIGYFDAVADGYSVERAKPAPDIFLFAAAALNVPPGECVVIEDAEAGVEAALAAGMLAVGIGPPERVGKAHLVYPSLADLRLEEILNYPMERAANPGQRRAEGIRPYV